MKKAVKLLSYLLVCFFSVSAAVPVSAVTAYTADINAKSAILIEAETGLVMYEKSADTAYPPASVTKIMTLLLVMEAIKDGKTTLDDMVSVSEHAASMGGSQIYLEPGEQMRVEELIKSVVIASANDAAAALAEHICGSEETFVSLMNERAAQLGMNNTHFENTNGLDDTTQTHLTSARDIAIMSAELLKHETIKKYTTIWMDSVRDGQFGLTNTNRLIRFYNGANGLKTGSTSKAGFCISATAKRGGMQLIAVIMGAPSCDIRNAEAAKLLDYGFATYGYYCDTEEGIEDIYVLGGKQNSCSVTAEKYSAVLEKQKTASVTKEIIMPDAVAAPVESGDKIGSVVYYSDGKEIGRADIRAAGDVEKISFWDILIRMLKSYSAAG